MGTRDTDLVPDFRNYDHLRRRFPVVSKPKVLGAFSIDKNREYHDDLENLKYLNVPGESGGIVHWDLNSGYENYLPKKEKDNCNIDHILEFIVKNEKKIKNSGSSKKIIPDFVSFRGLLRLIMCTPYEARPRDEPWIVLATKYRGTIYLCQKETPEAEAARRNMPEDQEKFCYYGFKFEQYILTKEPNKSNDLSKPVIANEEFAVAFSSKFAGHNLLYVAEMDGIISDTAIEKKTDLSRIPVEFVEVKTKKREEHPQQLRNFKRFKLRKWWCQSFLAGIDSVFVGVRNNKGIVEKIERMRVGEMAEIGASDWSGSICMNFCIIFLDTVKAAMEDIDDPNTVIKFSFNPQFCNRILHEKFPGKSDLSFLPEWYIKFLECL
ncbi:decapping and exoribonuclease protein-like [Phlebotomus papatasi]|uniref:decapping and exoribonuclease protein-like n=1 Tax=Phlebotomus papatasi TaxID=29031 RepID=UPI0024845A5E|nr:decapping and exoribonuclease protein-like [Phlebotomus papatasi]